MLSLSRLTLAAMCRASQLTNYTFAMPVLVFYPTSRCNSRCISCDWWRSTGADDVTLQEIQSFANDFAALRTKRVVLSGGEPLLRDDLFEITRLMKRQGVSLHLLTSGLAVRRLARAIVESFDRVTISLDGSDAGEYATVRGVDGFEIVGAGVRALKTLAPALPITARATLHRANFRSLPRLIERASDWGADGMSFLSADVSSHAFGRKGRQRPEYLLLSEEEVEELEHVIDRTIQTHAWAFARGFVAESPAKLRRLPVYYRAMLGGGSFPAVACNAPWVSAVIEANGDVRPCFFHAPIGSVREKPLSQLLRKDLPVFRSTLDVTSNAVCERCVCSLKVGLRDAPWL